MTKLKEFLMESNDYEEYFKKLLKKAGKKITDMTKDEKKAFFDKVDKGWKAKKETD